MVEKFIEVMVVCGCLIYDQVKEGEFFIIKWVGDMV